MGRLLRRFRYELHTHWKRSSRHVVQRWHAYCDKASQSRSRLIMMHYSGSKSFAHYQYELDRMMEIRSLSLAEGSTPPIDDDICDEVLDRIPIYVTELGYRVMAPSSSRAAHVSCDARLHETERRHAEIDRRHQEEIADLWQANAELSSQLQAFGIKLDELCHRMPPPQTFDIPADAYDQDSTDDDDDASPTGL
ncbi:hypothetical protein COCNU_scaffold014163G000010 [Cocos nucifera]|nr:hypothetical protein [Cocos nucifera]